MLSMSVLAVSAAEAAAYVTERGLSGWPAAEPAQLSALRRGQDWVASTYNGRWREAFENDAAPDLVKFAIIEAAVLEAGQVGALRAQASVPSQAKVLTRVGSIGWTARERRSWDSDAVRVPFIEELLAPLVWPVGPPAVMVV